MGPLPDYPLSGSGVRVRLTRVNLGHLSTGLSHVQDQLTLWLESALDSPALLPGVALFALVDSLFPLLPSETILSAGAAWSGSTGTPDIFRLFWFAVAGAALGDNLCFFAGRRFQNLVARITPDSAPGRALDWIRRSLDLYGGAAIISARFIPWARWALTLTLGSVRYSWPRFFLYDTIGVFIWAGMIISAGYLGGTLFEGSPLIGMVTGIVAGTAVGAVVHWVQKRALSWREKQSAGPRE